MARPELCRAGCVVVDVHLPADIGEEERNLAAAGGIRNPVRRELDQIAREDFLHQRHAEPVHAGFRIQATSRRIRDLQLLRRRERRRAVGHDGRVHGGAAPQIVPAVAGHDVKRLIVERHHAGRLVRPGPATDGITHGHRHGRRRRRQRRGIPGDGRDRMRAIDEAGAIQRRRVRRRGVFRAEVGAVKLELHAGHPDAVEAFAETVMVPDTVAPAAGAVIDTVGGVAEAGAAAHRRRGSRYSSSPRRRARTSSCPRRSSA